MPATELCSVVIPTAGDRSHLLAQSLERLLDDAATGEVIVILDNVDPATDRLVSEWHNRDSRVHARRISADSGPNWGAAARNRGARQAKHEIVLGLDDDVLPAPGLVSGHARRHSEDTGVVVLGYMPVALPPKDQRGAFCTALLYSNSYEAACKQFDEKPESVLHGLWGGNFSARRTHWLDVEAEPGQLRYHGDRAFGLRMREMGLRGVFDRALRGDHFYRRAPADLVEQSVASGIDTAVLQSKYPELVIPPRRGRLGRPLARLCRYRIGYETLRLVLLACVRIASGLRLMRAECVAVRGLALIAFERGYRVERAARR